MNTNVLFFVSLAALTACTGSPDQETRREHLGDAYELPTGGMNNPLALHAIGVRQVDPPTLHQGGAAEPEPDCGPPMALFGGEEGFPLSLDDPSQELGLYPGPQGGYHFWIATRAGGGVRASFRRVHAQRGCPRI